MAGTAPSLLDAARAYLRRGYVPVPVPAGVKGPRLAGWQRLRLTESELPAHFGNAGNIGLILGDPSGGLTDVDLDCDEARTLAPQYLPETPAMTGRLSAPQSHWWYTAVGAIKPTQYRDPADKSVIVELRSTGQQTLVGPSIHVSGEPYDLLEGEPARVDAATLATAVAALADAIRRARRGDAPNVGERGRTGTPPVATLPPPDNNLERRAAAYLDAMPPAISGQGGHNATYAAATALVHGFGLSPVVALRLLLDRFNPRCVPPWSEKELRHKVVHAADKSHNRPRGWLLGAAESDGTADVDLSAFNALTSGPGPPAPCSESILPPTAWELLTQYPALREPVIHGLLRRGETMNVISSPKVGKSWLVLDLALAMTTGQPWLNIFPTERGEVLILDNELHPQTIAHRIQRVANARDLPPSDYGDRLRVHTMRGQLEDIFSLGALFKSLPRDRFALILLDAFYRFMPADCDENDNGTMANLYNHLDLYAEQLGCCFVLIHHTTKGNQSGKSITDVGAGAGSQSRATDTHLILRPHEEQDAVVLEAAVRSWPPVKPRCLRWQFPVWQPADDLDPAQLKSERPKRRSSEIPDTIEPPAWTVERFTEAFLSDQPLTKAQIRDAAKDEPGLSWRRVADLLDIAESQGFVHRWQVGSAHRVLYATVPQPSDEEACP